MQDLYSALLDLGQRIDADLAAGARDRAEANAELGIAAVGQWQAHLPVDQLAPYMTWGEQFFRWGLYDAGGEYWKALFRIFAHHNLTEEPAARHALLIAACFQLMGGTIPAGSDQARHVVHSAQASLGATHPLVLQISPLGGTAPSAPAPAPNYPAPPSYAAPSSAAPPPMGSPAPYNMSSSISVNQGAGYGGSQGGFAQVPAQPPQAVPPIPTDPRQYSDPFPPGLSAREQLALWLTLAFLEIANADGVVTATEHQAFMDIMKRMSVADLSGQFDLSRCHQLRADGSFARMTAYCAHSMDLGTRNRMVPMLLQLVSADGDIDSRELDAVKRIATWLGVHFDGQLPTA